MKKDLINWIINNEVLFCSKDCILELLYEKHYKEEFGVIYRKICKDYDSDDLEDLSQELLILLSNTINDYDKSRNIKFTTFLTSRIKNKVKDYTKENILYSGNMSRRQSAKLIELNNKETLTNKELEELKNLSRFTNTKMSSDYESFTYEQDLDDFIQFKKDVVDGLYAKLEIQVINLLIYGYSQIEIADKLNYSDRYIRKIIKCIREKSKHTYHS